MAFKETNISSHLVALHCIKCASKSPAMLLLADLGNHPSHISAKPRQDQESKVYTCFQTMFQDHIYPRVTCWDANRAVSVFKSREYGCGWARLLLAYFAQLLLYRFIFSSRAVRSGNPEPSNSESHLALIFFSNYVALRETHETYLQTKNLWDQLFCMLGKFLRLIILLLS